jgi:predicted site-specific integrase-resolvase
MNTVYMLLGLYNKPRLNIEEVAQAIGISVPTAYTWRSLGKLPIPMTGNPLMADVRDVAEHLDHLREEARKMQEGMKSYR